MKNKGSIIIEFAALMPLVATFILLIFQFAALFTQSVHDVATAEALSSSAINKWVGQNKARGFTRPCLERMETHEFQFGGKPIAIGAGAWQQKISVPQEVRVVTKNICDN